MTVETWTPEPPKKCALPIPAFVKQRLNDFINMYNEFRRQWKYFRIKYIVYDDVVDDDDDDGDDVLMNWPLFSCSTNYKCKSSLPNRLPYTRGSNFYEPEGRAEFLQPVSCVGRGDKAWLDDDFHHHQERTSSVDFLSIQRIAGKRELTELPSLLPSPLPPTDPGSQTMLQSSAAASTGRYPRREESIVQVAIETPPLSSHLQGTKRAPEKGNSELDRETMWGGDFRFYFIPEIKVKRICNFSTEDEEELFINDIILLLDCTCRKNGPTINTYIREQGQPINRQESVVKTPPKFHPTKKREQIPRDKLSGATASPNIQSGSDFTELNKPIPPSHCNFAAIFLISIKLRTQKYSHKTITMGTNLRRFKMIVQKHVPPIDKTPD
ncbi:hypothetical protein ABEB36_006941 [Hypothenemus hampei]|uniref:Uncharacterized protein n=1 Tax=Hypothenemus hampei TaxID=57062 RepID=A0ABD1ES95_HYPHA